jgi:hypothetical protein
MNATIQHNFKYHPPTGSDPVKHALIRDKAKELALLIDETLPATAGREKATAITKCEEAMMWACAGICRHPAPDITMNSTR